VLVRGVEQSLLPAVAAAGQGFIPYFPLASGLLTGKYRQGAPMPEGSRLSYSKRHISRFVHEEYWTAVAELEAFCAARGRTLLELAFGWLLGNPLVATVIAGASRPEQLDDNVKASGWRLTPDERTEVDRITHDLPAPPGPE
jgi:aryl-alcohol dehydrogenase-like predicted oxidoreductase